MRNSLLLVLITVPLWGAATFTSTQTGNWDNPTTWGFGAGTCVYHSTCPAMTDGGDAGDKVLLGNLAHTVSCPTGVTCSAGNSPTSDTDSHIAIGAVSYTNTTAVLAVAAGATLIYAGPVRQNNAAWTFGAGSTVQYDASWTAGTPTTVLYTWSTNHSGTTGGRLTLNGSSGSHITWNGAGNSASASACNSNACRSGRIGASAGDTNPDAGTLTCAYTDFLHLGEANVDAFGKYGYYLSIRNQTSTIDSCTFTDGAPFYIRESNTGGTGTGDLTFDKWQVNLPSTTTTSYPGVQIDRAITSATRVVKNSYFNGSGVNVASNVGPSISWDTILFEIPIGQATNFGFGYDGGSGAGQVNTDSIFFWNPNDSAFDRSHGSPGGTHTRWFSGHYTNVNGGNEHSWYASYGLGATFDHVVVEGQTFGSEPDYIAGVGLTTAGKTFTVKNSVFTCRYDGKPPGAHITMVGGSTPNAAYSMFNNTACGGVYDDAHSFGFGVEFANGDPGAWVVVVNNLFNREDALGGVNIIAGNYVTPAPAVPGLYSLVGYNAAYNNNLAQPYSAGALASGHFAVGPINDQSFTRAVSMLDKTRRLIFFDVDYLGYPLSSTVWAVGQNYSVGQIVSDSQGAVYGGKASNWRMKFSGTGCTTSAAINRPVTGTRTAGVGYLDCWEPAALAYLRTSTLAGEHTYTAGGFTGLSMIGALVEWIRQGHTPTGADAALMTGSGYGNGYPTYIGAMDPASPATASSTVQPGITLRPGVVIH